MLKKKCCSDFDEMFFWRVSADSKEKIEEMFHPNFWRKIRIFYVEAFFRFSYQIVLKCVRKCFRQNRSKKIFCRQFFIFLFVLGNRIGRVSSPLPQGNSEMTPLQHKCIIGFKGCKDISGMSLSGSCFNFFFSLALNFFCSLNCNCNF